MARGRDLVLARLFYQIEADSKGLDAELKSAERSIDRLAKFIVTNPVSAAGALGAALIGVGVKATVMALEVDKAIRKITTLVPEATDRFAELRTEMIRLSVQSGRSAADLAQAGLAIAKGGVSGVDELKDSLNAAVKAADASGEDLATIIQGLDKVMDQFGLSGRDAEAVLAKIFVTAQGKTSIVELLEAFDRLTPVIEKNGLSFETAAQALATLIDRGFTTKQVVAELGKLDVAGIEKLAAASKTSSDGLQELEAAAKAAHSELDVLIERDIQRLNGALISLGSSLKPLAEKGLAAIAAALDGIAKHKDLLLALATMDTGAIALAVRRARDTVDAGSGARHPRPSDTATGPSALERPTPIILSPEDIAKAEAAALKLRKKITEALTDTLPTTLEGTSAAIAHLAAELTKAGAPAEEVSKAIKPLLAQLDRLRDAALGEQIRQTLESVELSSTDGLERQAALLEGAIDRLRQLRSEKVTTLGVDQTGPESVQTLSEIATLDKEIEETNKRLVAVRKEGTAAAEQTEIADTGSADALARAQAEIAKSERHVVEVARGVGDIVRGAIGAAQAFGGMTAATAAALQNVVTIGQTLPGVISQLSHLGDFGAIFDFASFATGIAGVVGSLSGLLSQLFGGGESPEQKQAREIAQRNIEAVEKLTREIGNLSLDVTGKQFVTAGKAVEALLKKAATKEFDLGLGKGGPLGQFELSFKTVNAILSGAGTTLRQLEDLAASVDVTLDTSSTQRFVESLRELQHALAETELTRFAQTIAGQLDALDAEFRFFNIDDPIEQLQRLVEILGKVGETIQQVDINGNPIGPPIPGEATAPIIADALKGLDLSLAKDRDEFKRRLGEILKQLEAGTLDAAQLGDLTAQELLDAILRLGGLIDQANQDAAAGGSSTNFVQENRITETTGTRMAGILESGLVYQQEIAGYTAVLPDILAALLSSPLVVAPPLPAALASESGVVVSVSIASLQLLASPAAPASQALQAAEALADVVEQVLTDRINARQALQGRTLQ